MRNLSTHGYALRTSRSRSLDHQHRWIRWISHTQTARRRLSRLWCWWVKAFGYQMSSSYINCFNERINSRLSFGPKKRSLICLIIIGNENDSWFHTLSMRCVRWGGLSWVHCVIVRDSAKGKDQIQFSIRSKRKRRHASTKRLPLWEWSCAEINSWLYCPDGYTRPVMMGLWRARASEGVLGWAGRTVGVGKDGGGLGWAWGLGRLRVWLVGDVRNVWGWERAGSTWGDYKWVSGYTIRGERSFVLEYGWISVRCSEFVLLERICNKLLSLYCFYDIKDVDI